MRDSGSTFRYFYRLALVFISMCVCFLSRIFVSVCVTFCYVKENFSSLFIFFFFNLKRTFATNSSFVDICHGHSYQHTVRLEDAHNRYMRLITRYSLSFARFFYIYFFFRSFVIQARQGLLFV